MKRLLKTSIAVHILAALSFIYDPCSSDAFDKIIDFETGNLSQLTEPPLTNVSIVPATLNGAGSHAFRCRIPQGASQTYCGFNIYLNDFPLVSPQLSDLYVRYYIKFEPSWRFATDNIYFKSQIIEVNAVDYNAGGRSFINFNSISESIADIVFLSYSDSINSWRATGRTITNDGQWHCIETRHLRNLADPSQGRFQFWFDGQLVLNVFPINMGNVVPAHLTFGYRNGTAQQDMYMQYDEVVIADHYIGPIGTPANPPPSSPQNLRVN